MPSMSSPRYTLPGRETKGGGNRVSRAEPTAFLAQHNHCSTLRGLRQSAAHAGCTAGGRATCPRAARTHSTSLFVCEQKATGQHLLVARKMSGSQLKLTFYKGVETETWMINFTTLLHAQSVVKPSYCWPRRVRTLTETMTKSSNILTQTLCSLHSRSQSS